jgi:type IV pilus biogenesis protein CpaD/CtpE
MTLRPTLAVFALSASLALAACGEDTTGDVASEGQSTPEQAITEIGNVRTSLDEALAAVKSGDTAKAEEILSEGYVEHFEKVEGPLEKVDTELNEELEEVLSKDIREKVKSGASAAEVQALVEDIKADLDTAEAKLK